MDPESSFTLDAVVSGTRRHYKGQTKEDILDGHWLNSPSPRTRKVENSAFPHKFVRVRHNFNELEQMDSKINVIHVHTK